MSPIAISVVTVDDDLKNVVWAAQKDHSSMVNGKPSYWMIREKYCPDNNSPTCFSGQCEFAKKYPGSGQGKPCLEFVRKMEAAKSIAAAKEVIPIG